MNKIIFFLLLSFNVFAITSSNINLNAGVGFASSRGIVGASFDKFLTSNQAVSGSLGFDIIGQIVGVGWKFFDNSIQKNRPTKTFLDRCFFLFDCDVHPYVGINGIYSSSTTIKFSEESNSREYAVGDKFLGQALLGFRDIFSSGFTLDVEISYRSLLSGGDISQLNGNYSSKDINDIKNFNNSFGFGLALGYLF